MPAVDYCRSARRLRRQFTNQPTILARKLRDLARRHDSQDSAPLASPSRTQTFAAAVLNKLEGRDLRYSNRLYLLDLADKLGVKRFDANLIIATLQHRAKPLPKIKPRTSSAGTHFSPTLIAFAIVQSTILAAMAYLIWA